MMLLAVFLLGFLASLTTSRANYDGFKVFQLDTGHERPSEWALEQLDGLNYDIHHENTLGNLTVAISPDNITAFEALGLPGMVLHDDFGAAIKAESATGKLTHQQSTHDRLPSCHSPGSTSPGAIWGHV